MSEYQKPITPPGYRWLIGIFVLAAVLRLGWVLARYSGDRAAALEYPDEQAYCLSAQSLAAGTGLIDEFGFRATYMPGYPFFLALFQPWPRPLMWARMAQAVLAATVAPATMLLAWQWVLLIGRGTQTARPIGPWCSRLAGLAAAVDPFLLFFSGLLLTEALSSPALVAAWALVLRLCRRDILVRFTTAARAGVLLWACVMLRPSSVVFVPLAVVAIVLWRHFDRAGLMSAGVILLAVLVGLAPWAVRNRLVIGQWRWLTTRGGISLYDGLGEGASGASDLAHTKTLPAVRGLSECEWDCFFRTQALAAARRDPGRVLRLAAVKFARTWSPTPNVESYRHGLIAHVAAAWMLTLLATAAVGLWECRGAIAAWSLLLGPLLATTLLHAVFVGSVRYRVPVMPMLMVLSAIGAVRLFERYGPSPRIVPGKQP